LIKIRIFIF